MSGSNDRDEVLEPSSEIEDANEVYRNYNESRRPLHRARVERALNDAAGLLDQEHDDSRKGREIESAIEHLKRIADCMADEPLPCTTSEALESEDWLAYDELRYQYGVSGNMPMLLDAFVILVENGVSPGRWILEPLAEAFGRILDDQDASLVATRLALQGKGSGSSSPLQDYSRQIEGAQINLEMKTLIEEFAVSQMNAANAVIEKFGLELQPKTLVNRYQSRTKFPDLVRTLLDKHTDVLGGSTVWLTGSAAQNFLNSFPPSAQKYLKSASPPKT